MEEIDMKKFNIETIKGQEYVVFADGTITPIHTHKEYGKYIYVDNKLNQNEDSVFNTLFTGRIKDAVETIRNGDGDVIETGRMFGSTIGVLYFLDRTIGEELRQKSIKGWDNATFGWIITCGNKDSMWGYSPLTNGYKTYSQFFDKETKPIVFDNREDAVKYIKKIISTSKNYAYEYVEKAKDIADEEGKRQICIDMIHKIEEDFNEKFTIIAYFATDMLDSDKMIPKNNFELDKYGYSIEQYCLPTE